MWDGAEDSVSMKEYENNGNNSSQLSTHIASNYCHINT